MIISASYKTDIPTFYGQWFMNRLHAGYCKMVNPYGGQIYTIDLTRESVAGFVFWTKNIGPFMQYLPALRELGYPFMVQHSINGYPRELEFRVLDYAHTCAYMHQLAADYGADVAVWRYDPIAFTSLTTLDWHRHNFATLARILGGATNEVVISFAQVYKKTQRNMDWVAREFAFAWDQHETIVREHGRELVIELAQIAKAHGMQLKVCSQAAFLVPESVVEARCVDAERLERITGTSLVGKIKLQGNRKECGCFASRDIGAYDTCPHGCVYCYAVQQRDAALLRYKQHDPESEFLFPPH